MTNIDVMTDAIRAGDAVLVGRCVDQFRAKCRMNYAQIFALARTRIPDLTIAAWDGLLEEADYAEGNDP